MHENAAHTVVVGVDGSDRADRALDWSIDEALLRSAGIRIVTAWHVPLAAYAGHGASPAAGTTLEDTVRIAAEGIADAAADRVRATTKEVPVETRVIQGQPAEVLIDTASGADLLVLGAPGRRHGVSGAWTSPAVQCVVHAPCPTAVVH
jgi:nucleotide-binding universal stress UspA family protein